MPELLLLGQIHNNPAPAAPAAEVYYKSNSSYGASAGATDVKLVFESQDFAPAGPIGRCVARRLYITVEYGGSVTLRITPITDFSEAQTATSFSLASPVGGRRRAVIEVPMAKPCTYIRCKVEVLSRDGLFWLHGIKLAHKTLSNAYEQIAGRDV